LAVTYLGDFFFLIGQKGQAHPTHFFVFNAFTGMPINKLDQIDPLLVKIPQVQGLQFASQGGGLNEKTKSLSDQSDFEIIAEVQSGEDWYDYKPAPAELFIGREALKSNIFNFFTKALKNESKNRVFYLNGNSGWGKSSLINAIKATSQNKYYRNRMYTVALDCRSASSENFVVKAFEKAINKSFADEFVSKDSLKSQNPSFTSNYSLLDSTFIIDYLAQLKASGKLLVLIFDQFEDVFRKAKIFKYFYKFLSDVGEVQANIIVGFSWKSEFLIQAESDTYSYFQQAKDQAVQFEVSEFGIKETNGIIKQLEGSLSLIEKKKVTLESALKNRLVEGSQGFPWLIKKLCIHVFNEIKSGSKTEDLIDDNLNIESLFKADLSKIVKREQQVLELVAQKAVSTELFDENDINEYNFSNEIKSLIDKRLIIRSGYYYNVYWDTFRDYLVTGKVPNIHQGYIFKQGPTPCLKVFLSFSKNRTQSFEDLLKNQEQKIGKGALYNILIELRKLELIRKKKGEDVFQVNEKTKITADYFKNEIRNKVKGYSTYHQLRELSSEHIEPDQITEVLKSAFKGLSHKDATWKTYTNYFSSWINYLELELSDKIKSLTKGKPLKDFDKENDSLLLRGNPNKAYSIFNQLVQAQFKDVPQSVDLIRDFRVLKILELDSDHLSLSEIGMDFLKCQSEKDFNRQLVNRAFLLSKIQTAYNEYSAYDFTSTYFAEHHPDFFGHDKTLNTKIQYASKIISWTKFIYSVKNNGEKKTPKKSVRNTTPLKKKKSVSIKRDNGQTARGNNYRSEWLRMYSILIDYKKLNGHCNVPARHKHNNDPLGTWVVRQRAIKNNLDIELVKRLDDIDFDWSPNETAWDNMYRLLKQVFEDIGHTNIPVQYPKNKTLGAWVFTQRTKRRNNKLSLQKIDLLDDLNFVWNARDVSWLENFELLKEFHTKHGHFIVPVNSRYQQLYNWFNLQKRRYRNGSLEADRISSLEEIGFSFQL
jgi:hypothetical protein